MRRKALRAGVTTQNLQESDICAVGRALGSMLFAPVELVL
jgi:hypothetical protein